jgi:methyl-accepting chemotaxis protein
MRSIRGRLLGAFFGVIGIFSLASLVFFAVNFSNLQRYKSLSDTMVAEYRLVDNEGALIDAFNHWIQSAGTSSTTKFDGQLDKTVAEIGVLTAFLDSATLDIQSQSDYLGFKASVENLTNQIKASIQRSKEGGIKDYFDDYNKANKLYGFVRDNGTALIFSQLQYASSIRDEIDRTYRLSIVFGCTGFALLILACALFVLRFSRQITGPLQLLTDVTEKIAGGDTRTALSEKLLQEKSEIGSLARSFNVMITRLFENIQTLNTSNTAIESKNAELEHLNKFMIDREVKMIELKKRIHELEGTKPEEEMSKALVIEKV